MGTGVSRLRGGGWPDQRPALCRGRVADRRQLRRAPRLSGLQASGGAQPLRAQSAGPGSRRGHPAVHEALAPWNPGAWQSPASVRSLSCLCLLSQLHSVSMFMRNLLFLASCHCSSEGVSRKEPRSAVVLPVAGRRAAWAAGTAGDSQAAELTHRHPGLS